MLIKSALRVHLSVSYGMIGILLTGSLRSPPPIRLRRNSPYAGGRINRSMLSCRDMAPWLSIHSPTTKWGQGGGASHQRGIAFPRPQGGCKGFIQTGAFYKFRGATTTLSGRAAVKLKNPRAIAPSNFRTLTSIRACQPSGIRESTAQVPNPGPDPDRATGA